MGLREEKKFELRRQILTTAVGMFGERGMGDTRVADIAKLLRISEATFFNYFPTKQAVCEEAVADVVSTEIDDALASDGSVHDQLFDLAAGLGVAFSADRPLVTLVRHHPDIVVAGWMRTARSHPALTHRIHDAQAAGELRNDVEPALVSEMLLDVLLTTLARRLATTTSETTDPDDAPDVVGTGPATGPSLSSQLHQALAVCLDGCAPRTPSRRRSDRRRTARAKPQQTV